MPGARRAHHGHRRGGNLASDEFSCVGQSAEHHAVASVTLSVPPARNAGLPCWICCRWRPSQVRSSAAIERFADVQSGALERQVEGQEARPDDWSNGRSDPAPKVVAARAPCSQPASLRGGGHLRIGRAEDLPCAIDQRDEGEARCFPLGGRQAGGCTRRHRCASWRNSAAVISNSRAPSPMLSTSPASNAACRAARSPTWVLRSDHWLQLTATWSPMVGTRQKAMIRSNRIVIGRPPIRGRHLSQRRQPDMSAPANSDLIADAFMELSHAV